MCFGEPLVLNVFLAQFKKQCGTIVSIFETLLRGEVEEDNTQAIFLRNVKGVWGLEWSFLCNVT